MLKRFISIFILFIFFINGTAYSEEALSSARAMVVMDSGGKILYEQNKDIKLGMASTTKIMTAVCALEFGNLKKECTISKKASMVEGSSMYLKQGEKISLYDLVTGLMLVSGNDAATAISENVSKSEDAFVLLMNQKANEIGVKNTCFQNPHGLSTENHYTTASDLAKITSYALKNEKFAEIVFLKSKKVGDRYLVNHNKLLKLYDGCIGVKTGFTKSTGRCLVTAAKRDGLTLICVTLNDGNDWQDHINLYNRAFENYKGVLLAKKGDKIAKAKISGGKKTSVNLLCEENVVIAGKRDKNEKYIISIPEKIKLTAPIEKGKVYIKGDVLLKDKKIGEVNLVAEENVLAEVKKESWLEKLFKKR